MKRSTCAVGNCNRPGRTRGLCDAHYSRWLRHGDVKAHIPLRQVGRSEIDRFWDRVEKSDGCWLWTGFINPDGYGQFTVDARVCVRAHRYSYELANGPISDGLQIDHVRARGCVNRHCVNPSHLEAVTPLENTRRSNALSQQLRERTHCGKGHPLSGSNLGARSDGHRKCLACHRSWQAAYLARKAVS